MRSDLGALAPGLCRPVPAELEEQTEAVADSSDLTDVLVGDSHNPDLLHLETAARGRTSALKVGNQSSPFGWTRECVCRLVAAQLRLRWVTGDRVECSGVGHGES